jgi:hypothetical protein
MFLVSCNAGSRFDCVAHINDKMVKLIVANNSLTKEE